MSLTESLRTSPGEGSRDALAPLPAALKTALAALTVALFALLAGGYISLGPKRPADGAPQVPASPAGLVPPSGR